MNHAFNDSGETNSSYQEDDDDIIEGNMVLRGLIKMAVPVSSTTEATGKPEVVVALTVVLVVLVILLIISIFFLLYCVLKRQRGIERRMRDDYERKRRHRKQLKKSVTDLTRKAKVSRIAANIEAAVKSSETTLKSTEPPKQSQSPAVLPAEPLRPKSISNKLPTTTAQSETTVETPSLSTNQIFINRCWHGSWQQVEHEPSDFSYELESDSVNDNICLQRL